MPEHTPGTWSILAAEGFCPPTENGDLAIVAGGLIIAEVFHRIDNDLYAPVRANAQLLIAAPDLLTAGRGLIAYRDRVGPLNFQLEKADDHFNQLRAAIARATEVPHAS